MSIFSIAVSSATFRRLALHSRLNKWGQDTCCGARYSVRTPNASVLKIRTLQHFADGIKRRFQASEFRSVCKSVPHLQGRCESEERHAYVKCEMSMPVCAIPHGIAVLPDIRLTGSIAPFSASPPFDNSTSRATPDSSLAVSTMLFRQHAANHSWRRAMNWIKKKRQCPNTFRSVVYCWPVGLFRVQQLPKTESQNGDCSEATLPRAGDDSAFDR